MLKYDESASLGGATKSQSCTRVVTLIWPSLFIMFAIDEFVIQGRHSNYFFIKGNIHIISLDKLMFVDRSFCLYFLLASTYGAVWLKSNYFIYCFFFLNMCFPSIVPILTLTVDRKGEKMTKNSLWIKNDTL